jgi:DNA-binding PadR family transcriptional regulator
MEAKGWIEPEWGISPRGRRAKLYSLTKEGRKQLANEQQIWGQMVFAIGDVLKNT